MNIAALLFNAASQDQGKMQTPTPTGETGDRSADPFAELLSQVAAPTALPLSKAEPTPAPTNAKDTGKTGGTAEDAISMSTLAAFLQAAGLPVTVPAQGLIPGADSAAQEVSPTTAAATAGLSMPTVSSAQQPQSSTSSFVRGATAEGGSGGTAALNGATSLQGTIAAGQGDGGTATAPIVAMGLETATTLQTQTAQAQSSSSIDVTGGAGEPWKSTTAFQSVDTQHNAEVVSMAASSATFSGVTTGTGPFSAADTTSGKASTLISSTPSTSPVSLQQQAPRATAAASDQAAASVVPAAASTISSATAMPSASPSPDISVLMSDSALLNKAGAPVVLSASASPATEPSARSSQPSPSSTTDANKASSAASTAAVPAEQPVVSTAQSAPVPAPAQADPQTPQQQTAAAALSAPAESSGTPSTPARETALVGDQEKSAGAARLKTEKPGQTAQTAASGSIRQPTTQQGAENLSDRQASQGEGDREFRHLAPQIDEKAASVPQSESEPQQIAKQEPVTITVQQQSQLQTQPQTASAAAPASSESQKSTLHESILAQVTEKLDNRQAAGSPGQVTIKLNPADLGELKINVSIDAAQKVKVEIVTEHPTVKDALTDNLDRLKETFSRQNLTMEKFDVSTGGGQFNQPSRQGQWQNTAYAPFNSKAAFATGPAVTAENVADNHWNPRTDALVDVRF